MRRRERPRQMGGQHAAPSLLFDRSWTGSFQVSSKRGIQRTRLPLSMRCDTLDGRDVSTEPPPLDVAYAHARSARPRRQPRIRREARPACRLQTTAFTIGLTASGRARCGAGVHEERPGPACAIAQRQKRRRAQSLSREAAAGGISGDMPTTERKQKSSGKQRSLLLSTLSGTESQD